MCRTEGVDRPPSFSRKGSILKEELISEIKQFCKRVLLAALIVFALSMLYFTMFESATLEQSLVQSLHAGIGTVLIAISVILFVFALILVIRLYPLVSMILVYSAIISMALISFLFLSIGMGTEYLYNKAEMLLSKKQNLKANAE